MDPSTDIHQDPLTMNDNGATSFASDFDMSAINEAVAAGGEANQIQNSFDVNDSYIFSIVVINSNFLGVSIK